MALRDDVARVFAASPNLTPAQRTAVVQRLRDRQEGVGPVAPEPSGFMGAVAEFGGGLLRGALGAGESMVGGADPAASQRTPGQPVYGPLPAAGGLSAGRVGMPERPAHEDVFNLFGAGAEQTVRFGEGVERIRKRGQGSFEGALGMEEMQKAVDKFRVGRGSGDTKMQQEGFKDLMELQSQTSIMGRAALGALDFLPIPIGGVPVPFFALSEAAAIGGEAAAGITEQEKIAAGESLARKRKEMAPALAKAGAPVLEFLAKLSPTGTSLTPEQILAGAEKFAPLGQALGIIPDVVKTPQEKRALVAGFIQLAGELLGPAAVGKMVMAKGAAAGKALLPQLTRATKKAAGRARLAARAAHTADDPVGPFRAATTRAKGAAAPAGTTPPSVRGPAPGAARATLTPAEARAAEEFPVEGLTARDLAVSERAAAGGEKAGPQFARTKERVGAKVPVEAKAPPKPGRAEVVGFRQSVADRAGEMKSRPKSKKFIEETLQGPRLGKPGGKPKISGKAGIARAELEQDFEYLHAGLKPRFGKGAQGKGKKGQSVAAVFLDHMKRNGVTDEQIAGRLRIMGLKDVSKLSQDDMLRWAEDAGAKRFGKPPAPAGQVSREEAISNVFRWQQENKGVTERQMLRIVERALDRKIPRAWKWNRWLKKHGSDEDLVTLVDFISGGHAKSVGLVASARLTPAQSRLARIFGDTHSNLTPEERAALEKARPARTVLGNWWLARPVYRGTSVYEAATKAEMGVGALKEAETEALQPVVKVLRKSIFGKMGFGRTQSKKRAHFEDELNRLSDVMEGLKPASYVSPETQRLGQAMRQSYDRMAEILGLPEHQMLSNYVPWVKAKEIVGKHGKNWEQHAKELGPDGRMFAEYHRSVQEIGDARIGMERNALVLWGLYLRGVTKRVHLDPMYQKLTKPTDAGFLKSMERATAIVDKGKSMSSAEAKELLALQDDMAQKAAQRAMKYPREEPYQALTYGVAGEESEALGSALKKITLETYLPEMMGLPSSADVRWSGMANGVLDMVSEAGHKIHWHSLENWAASRIGSSSARSLSRSMLTLTYSGALAGRPKAAMKNATQAMITIGEIGVRWWAHGAKAGFTDFSKMMALAKKHQVFTAYLPGLESEINLYKSTLQGFDDYTMAMFSGTDKYLNRLHAFGGARGKFLHYAQKGEKQIKGLMVHVEEPSVRNDIMKAFSAGDVEEAAGRYGKWVSDRTQWPYTKADRPMMARGPVGRMAGQFMTFPMHWQNNLNRWAFGGATNAKDGAAYFAKHGLKRFLRYTATTTAVTYAAKETLGADLRDWVPYNPMAIGIRLAARAIGLDPDTLPVIKEIPTGSIGFDPGSTPWIAMMRSMATLAKWQIDSLTTGSKWGKVSDKEADEEVKKLGRSALVFMRCGLMMKDLWRFGRTSGINPEWLGTAEKGEEYQLTVAYPKGGAQWLKAQQLGLRVPPDKPRAGPHLRKGADVRVPWKAYKDVEPADYAMDRFLLPSKTVNDAYEAGEKVRQTESEEYTGVPGAIIMEMNRALGGSRL